MLQIIGGLYISGWVLGLVALITVLIKYKKKMKRIKNLYNYDRHCDTIVKSITMRASEIDGRILINNKEERRIELWEKSRGKDIHISSIYYVDDPEDISHQSNPYIAGFGGSGGYNPLDNAYSFYNVINYYYCYINTEDV